VSEVGYLVAATALALATWIAIGIRRARQWRRGLSNVDLDGVRVWLNRLINVRQPNAYLIFEEMTGLKRFVQLRRDVGQTGATLTCHFPKAPWSTVYVPTLKQVLVTENIPYSEASTRSNEPVVAFITIENLDVSSAVRLVDLIFRDVFRCGSVNVQVWGHGVSGDNAPPGARQRLDDA